MIKKSAFIKDRYRYLLTRDFTNPTTRKEGFVCWIMLNPSTADDRVDDPTTKRCISFTGREGYGELAVVNLFAYRTPHPKELKAAFKRGDGVIGPLNDHIIVNTVTDASMIILAWGANGHLGNRCANLIEYIEFARHKMYVFGYTKNGHPLHPLYVPSNTALRKLEGSPCTRY